MPQAKRTARTPEKRAPARPSWPDRFLAALPQYGSITGTAKAVRVGRRTVYDEMDRNPEFAERVREIRDQECVELVEATLFQQALQPDKTTDRIFYLKTHKPEKYAERLNPAQVAQIKEQAAQEVREELARAIAGLPEDARRIVAEAWNKTKKELTP